MFTKHPTCWHLQGQPEAWPQTARGPSETDTNARPCLLHSTRLEKVKHIDSSS